MQNVTASSLDRLLACPKSFSLKQDARASTRRAETGTAVHLEIENYIKKGIIPVLEQSRAAVSMLGMFTGKILVEQAYSFCFSSGEAKSHGDIINRGYPQGRSKYTVFGTADVVVLDSNGIPISIIDWKTGDGHKPANGNPQLLFFALCCLRMHGSIPNLSIGNLADGTIDMYVPSTQVLCKFQQKVFHAIDVADLEQTEYRAGLHCKYCPSKSSCPVAQRALAQVFSGNMTFMNASDAAQMVLIARQAVEEAEERLKAYCKLYGPVPLPDGSKYTEVQRNRTDIDPEVAESVAKDMGIDANSLFKRTFVKKLLDCSIPKPKQKEFYAELDRRGGIKRGSYSYFKVIRSSGADVQPSPGVGGSLDGGDGD